ncbi:hypothetical protein [Methylomonas sp. YC3]
MTTPGSRTIRECPECHGPCLFFNPDYGSIFISDEDDLFDWDDTYKNRTPKCPHCAKDFSISDAEITCIDFLTEYKASLLASGMGVNEFLDFLGVETYGKTYKKYKLFKNIHGTKNNEYDAYYVAFKALPEDYFSRVCDIDFIVNRNDDFDFFDSKPVRSESDIERSENEALGLVLRDSNAMNSDEWLVLPFSKEVETIWIILIVDGKNVFVTPNMAIKRSSEISISLHATCSHVLAKFDPKTPLVELLIGNGEGDCNDEHMANITHFEKLKKLILYCGNVTVDGFNALKKLSALEYLELRFSERVTDKKLDAIKDLSSLKFFKMDSSVGITDNGLNSIKALISLKTLILQSATNITDQGLEALSTMTSLEYLDLDQCSYITDCGISKLISLINLKSLTLYHCEELTDKSIEQIIKFPKLEDLSLIGSPNISEQVINRLPTRIHCFTDISG